MPDVSSIACGAALTSTSGTPAGHQQRLLKMHILSHLLWHFLVLGNCLRSFKPSLSFSPTLSRQVKIPFVCLTAVEHLQRVSAFVTLCWVKDFNPDFLRSAARLCPGFLVNSLIPTWKEDLWKPHSYRRLNITDIILLLWSPELGCPLLPEVMIGSLKKNKQCIQTIVEN